MANTKSKSILKESIFTVKYWSEAASELTSVKSLVFAALIIALRVAVKAFRIPIASGVNFTFDCYVNAMGSIVYGPLVGLLVGAASDTLGCILFPSGTYFLPFILTEMFSSFVFALFLWRRQITTLRVLGAKFTINLIGNIVMNSVFMKWMYYALGDEKFYTYNIVNGVRIVKNLVLFPLEAILIVMLLTALIGSDTTSRFDWVEWNGEKIKINKRSVALSIFLTIITFGFYGIYWKYLMVKNLRSVDKDEKSCTKEMLCLIFLPFYSCYWYYTRGEHLRKKLSAEGGEFIGNGVIYLILSLLGVEIVALSILQHDFNELPSTKEAERPRIGPLKQLGVVPMDQKAIRLKGRDIALVIVLFLLSVALILTYVFWLKDVISPPKAPEPVVTETATAETEPALETVTNVDEQGDFSGADTAEAAKTAETAETVVTETKTAEAVPAA